MRLTIKNWAEFQHYSKRNPPWIKLHWKILQSKDWVVASDTDRLLAIVCMLIASQDNAGDGSFDADPDYFRRIAYLHSAPDFKPLIKLGFLTMLADASACLHLIPNARPEKEKETETETKSILAKVAKPRASRADILNGHKSDFDAFWLAYPRKVAKGSALKAYAKALSKADPGAILAGAKRYAGTRAKEPPEFTKHPGTWLNAECWLDGEVPQADPEWLKIQELERENLKRLGFTGGKNA